MTVFSENRTAAIIIISATVHEEPAASLTACAATILRPRPSYEIFFDTVQPPFPLSSL